MKPVISYSLLAVIFLISGNCFAQPGDLSHPALKKQARTSFIRSKQNDLNPIIIYDGVTIYNPSFMQTLNPKTIRSVQKANDPVFDSKNELKFQGFIEISTNDGINNSLKYIKEETDNFSKTYPLCAFYLNGQLLLNDKEKVEKLKTLEIKNIKEIKTLTSSQGRQQFGKTGENGVILITTG